MCERAEAGEVRLEVVDKVRLSGRTKVGTYFHNYDWLADWKLVPGLVDRRSAAVDISCEQRTFAGGQHRGGKIVGLRASSQPISVILLNAAGPTFKVGVRLGLIERESLGVHEKRERPMLQSQAQPSSLTDDSIISFNVIGSNFELGGHGVIRDFVLDGKRHV